MKGLKSHDVGIAAENDRHNVADGADNAGDDALRHPSHPLGDAVIGVCLLNAVVLEPTLREFSEKPSNKQAETRSENDRSCYAEHQSHRI